MKKFETLSFIAVLVIVSIGVYISMVNEEFFRSTFVVEDGYIENCTAFLLFLSGAVCFKRVWSLRKSKSLWFLFCTALLGTVFIFGAGEEISWGQRIFNLETTDYFLQNNSQKELNLHNLTYTNSEGELKRVNKLLFGQILTLIIVFYMLILPPIYKRALKLKSLVDSWAVPITQNRFIIAYLILFAIVSLSPSAKKGELAEFSGAFVFLWLVLNPYNRRIFNKTSVDV